MTVRQTNSQQTAFFMIDGVQVSFLGFVTVTMIPIFLEAFLFTRDRSKPLGGIFLVVGLIFFAVAVLGFSGLGLFYAEITGFILFVGGLEVIVYYFRGFYFHPCDTPPFLRKRPPPGPPPTGEAVMVDEGSLRYIVEKIRFLLEEILASLR